MKLFRAALHMFFVSAVFCVIVHPCAAYGSEDVLRLRLLVWGGYVPTKFVRQFENTITEKYGRKVTLQIVFVEKSDDFFDPVREKAADVITISHHLFKDERFGFISKNLLLPLDVCNIPNYKNLTPFLAALDYHAKDGKVYGAPVGQGSYGLAYDATKLSPAPDSWQVLWNPRFAKQYVIGEHEYLYNAAITALALGYAPETLSTYDRLNNKKFKEKLGALAQDAHSFYGGKDSVKVINGASLAVIWGDSLRPLLDNGQKWKMADTKEGIPWWIDDYAITWALDDNPFLKRVAEEWINMVLSPEFQVENNVRRLRIYPVVTNINGKLTSTEKQRVQMNGVGLVKRKRILQATASQRDRNGIKLLWDEAMAGTSN